MFIGFGDIVVLMSCAACRSCHSLSPAPLPETVRFWQSNAPLCQFNHNCLSKAGDVLGELLASLGHACWEELYASSKTKYFCTYPLFSEIYENFINGCKEQFCTGTKPTVMALMEAAKSGLVSNQWVGWVSPCSINTGPCDLGLCRTEPVSWWKNWSPIG